MRMTNVYYLQWDKTPDLNPEIRQKMEEMLNQEEYLFVG